MALEKTKKLIKKYLDKGYKTASIKKSFVKAGYKANEIDEALKEIKTVKTHKLELDAVFITLGVFAVIGLVIILWPSSDCGSDLECFSQKANKCESVTGYTMLKGNKIAMAENDCLLKKQITEFDDSEPEEVRLLLGDKIMECSYAGGEFDNAFFELTGNLEKCSGELKDMINSIRIAQLTS